MQVAAISGDARRALEICRRAAEISDYHIKKLSSNHNSNPAGASILWFSRFFCIITY